MSRYFGLSDRATRDGGLDDFAKFSALFEYDASTGFLVWKVAPTNSIVPGQRAGTIGTEGYVAVYVENRRYAVHRIAWLLSNGAWPNEFIDHIDGNKANNRLSNLREASRKQNAANRLARGIYYDGKSRKWRAEIVVNGKRHRLGRFSSEAQATAAYVSVHIKHHGEFSPYLNSERRP